MAPEKEKPAPKGPIDDDHHSPLDGLLEDPDENDGGVGSLDKALWDKTREESEVERDSNKS